MKRVKNIFTFIFLFVMFLGATWSLYGRGYFNMHDDLQVMRIYEMEKCFEDGQIPCRWAPDMGWGYGQPMFNFYSAFPYYLGYLIRIFTPLSRMATVLTLMNISLVASGFGMYLLAKKFWGRLGGMTAAVLYVYAPYHLLDVLIRGALSESFALAILPFLWLAIYSYILNPKFKNFLFTSITLFLLLTTHNLSTLMYAPFTALWASYWLLKEKQWKRLPGLFFATIMGVGLSAFFLFPVVVEKNLIQTSFLTMDYLNYEAHFVTIKQLFINRNWGHGPSIYGPNDDISFQVGWPHWFLIFPLLYLIIAKFKNKKFDKIVLTLGLFALFLFTAFLTHPRSIFIWKAFPMISIIQFPWRFLGLTVFFLSFSVSAIFYFKFWLRKLVFIGIILAVIVLNLGYTSTWDRSYKVTDEEKLSGLAFDLQRRSATLDYLPKTAQMAPKEGAFTKPEVTEGEGGVSNYITTSSTFSFDAEIYNEHSKIRIPIMYFPKWTVISDGKAIPLTVEGKYGLITIELAQGKHIVEGRFMDTPIRTVGNITTIVTMMILFFYYAYESDKKEKNKTN